MIVAARRRRLRLQGHAARRTSCSPRWPPRSSAARSSSRSPASRCSRSSATARRRSSASGSAPTRDGRLHRDRARRRRADLDASRSSPSRPRVATRMMYAAPNRRTTPPAGPRSTCPTPSWMRAPGRVPGHVRARVGDGRAGRSRCGLDPIELRIRNEPDVDPETGMPFSSAATSSPACARAPSASAGPAATRARARGATGAGWSAPASPPSTYPARRAGPRRRDRARSSRRPLRRARSPPPTSAPARARR